MESQLTPKHENFQILELIKSYVRHWPWYIISVAICCSIAFLYIQTRPVDYMRGASVLIKEDNASDLTAAFSEKNPFKAAANVNNEVEAFKSPHLMQEVVKRLNLNISYTIRDGLKDRELYTHSPIKVISSGMQEQEFFSFYVELLPDSLLLLSGFEQNAMKFEPTSKKAKLNEMVNTPIGNIEISPTFFYSGTYYNVPIKVSQSSIRSTTAGFSGNLSVALASKENTIINLNYTDVSIQRADDILNTIIAVYNEEWLREKRQIAENTSKFIDDRLPFIENELGGIDDNLQKYKSSNLLTDVRSAASLYMKESSEYSAKVVEVSNQLSIAKNIKESLDRSSKTLDLLPTNTGLSNTAVESSLEQYNALLLQRNKLLANSSERNPVIVDMNNDLNGMMQSIISTIDNLVSALDLQLSSLRTQNARMTQKIASNPGQEKHLISIEREQKIKESLYLYLLQKREENELSLAMTTTNTRVINPPTGSSRPISPKKKMIMAVAFVLGMILPTSVIWGKDMMNTTIQGKKDLKKLSVPLLGVIPLASQARKKANMKAPLVKENSRDMVNEAFRSLRTNIDFFDQENIKTVMFTSYEAGVGKTFMTLNLAMCFALAGKKVIALDLDMRKAALSTYVSSDKAGITDYLNGTATVGSIINKNYFYPGFDVVTIGKIPANPVELLMNGKLTPFLEAMKTYYDYIFIDGVPVNPVTDATIIGRYSDMNIFVIRENFSDHYIIPELENIYHNGKFKNMTILLNGSVQNASSEKYFASKV
ncbi:MAG: polysaccharide biosynthesis tyrosine autokinase [Bacteroidales bacterium]|jgi:capsular exopolysaccharide synthesis family protein|nr:polysaccharide biosynthesis tyrosine autokinase [Bacteroidales bacterium]